MTERLRRGGMFLALIAVSAPACALLPATAQASLPVTLRPAAGGPRTGFVLRFRNPSRTGIIAGIRRVDKVLVSGPRGSGCVSSVVDSLRPAAASAGMRTVLRPGGGRHWCRGRFRGRLVVYQSAVCNPGPARACPLLLVAPAPQTLARFSFEVRSSSSNGGGSGASGGTGGGGTGGGGGAGGAPGTDIPTFAGLRSATTCTGAAPVHGSPPGRTYTLSWPAATDPVTPSSAIVYDIFFAAAPGAENFSSPTWTTAPGATAYSGNLATSGSAYFVVRARNQVGHEDANTVEKLAVNNC